MRRSGVKRECGWAELLVDDSRRTAGGVTVERPERAVAREDERP
jgi:hypothetical protein